MSLPTPTQRFFGGLLMGVGGLMMALCGACSTLGLIFLLPGLVSAVIGLLAGRSGGEVDSYTVVFVQTFVLFGLVPILVGWGLFVVGRRMRGEAPAPKVERTQPPGDDAP